MTRFATNPDGSKMTKEQLDKHLRETAIAFFCAIMETKRPFYYLGQMLETVRVNATRESV